MVGGGRPAAERVPVGLGQTGDGLQKLGKLNACSSSQQAFLTSEITMMRVQHLPPKLSRARLLVQGLVFSRSKSNAEWQTVERTYAHTHTHSARPREALLREGQIGKHALEGPRNAQRRAFLAARTMCQSSSSVCGECSECSEWSCLLHSISGLVPRLAATALHLRLHLLAGDPVSAPFFSGDLQGQGPERLVPALSRRTGPHMAIAPYASMNTAAFQGSPTPMGAEPTDLIDSSLWHLRGSSMGAAAAAAASAGGVLDSGVVRQSRAILCRHTVIVGAVPTS